MKLPVKNEEKLADYKELDYFVPHIDLTIDLSTDPVVTKSKLTVKPNSKKDPLSNDLILDGTDLTLLKLSLNGEPVKYTKTDDSLIIHDVPKDVEFTIESECQITKSTDLFGYYETEGVGLVKAETRGLRKVLFLPDRPDNLATYKTTIIANKSEFPVLLSNGIQTETYDLGIDKHAVVWEDSLPKPSYLFALVAGNLSCTKTEHLNKEGKKLPILFYVPSSAIQKCNFAKEALKTALSWAEKRLNLVCDLPEYKIAGVDKYASGASEPTGMNLFNTANLFASPEVNTDLAILRVLEVVIHEFFHFWSGDKVTIRDWFNLPLKEGLTTFLAAIMREEMFGTDLVRLLDGKNLDARAPRQSSFTEVRSLYTPAAYEKSADIIRMMMTIIGKEKFLSALTQYFIKHDGQAITLETFLDTMSEFTGTNLRGFLPWFTESDIPTVHIEDRYDQDSMDYELIIKVDNFKHRPIPMVLGLINEQGKEILKDSVFILDNEEKHIILSGIDSHPTPSLFRSFSAPVVVDYKYSEEELLRLIRFDTNLYNRCEAAKTFFKRYLENFVKDDTITLSKKFFITYEAILQDKSLSNWIKAELLTIPTLEELILDQEKPNFDKLAMGRSVLQLQIANKLNNSLIQSLHNIEMQFSDRMSPSDTVDIEAVAYRKLWHAIYSFLIHSNAKESEEKLSLQFYDSFGKNMTESVSALSLLCEMGSHKVDNLLTQYYNYWKNDVAAINTWFSIQASAHNDTVLTRVPKLTLHPDFDFSNPNKVYALLGNFIINPYGFHAENGEGYKFITDCILKIEKLNPTLAARLTEKFSNYKNFDANRSGFMLECINRLDKEAESDAVRNLVKKILNKPLNQSPIPIELTFMGKSTTDSKQDNPEENKASLVH